MRHSEHVPWRRDDENEVMPHVSSFSHCLPSSVLANQNPDGRIDVDQNKRNADLRKGSARKCK